MSPATLQRNLFTQLAEPFTGEALFDCLTDLVFFIKNVQGQYVVVNQEMVTRCGRREKRDLLGKRADEVYPAPFGQSYRAQDEALFETGQPILNQLELQLYHSGSPGWCLTNKLPLRGRQGRIVGLVGISRDLQVPNLNVDDYEHIAKAIQYAQENLSDPLRLAGLAKQVGLSPYQFDRRMRKIFQLTTGQFVHKVRLEAAMRLLRETDDPVVKIAQTCGYSDHSAFTRQFHRTVGLSPSDVRLAARAEKKP
jgi:AraC-like DNA-binding protein